MSSLPSALFPKWLGYRGPSGRFFFGWIVCYQEDRNLTHIAFLIKEVVDYWKHSNIMHNKVIVYLTFVFGLISMMNCRTNVPTIAYVESVYVAYVLNTLQVQ